jgi:hypothetical protein
MSLPRTEPLRPQRQGTEVLGALEPCGGLGDGIGGRLRQAVCPVLEASAELGGESGRRCEWAGQDSNLDLTDYESAALTD